jgi:mannosyltransferase OCH1-like enzyme
MIPKVIHYVWVGPKTLGTLQSDCITSWKRHLPDFELKLWNEDNLPKEVLDHPYVRTMYQKKKWAFVSDYIRFWVLEREGGIYLDTDTEVLKSFNPLLEHKAFFGRTKDGMVAAGVIGSMPHHQAIKDILKVYEEDATFDTHRTSPRTVTEVLRKGSYPNVEIYDYRYFNPCNDGERCTSDKLTLAYTNNHWAESWVKFAPVRKLLRRLGLIRLLKLAYGKI